MKVLKKIRSDYENVMKQLNDDISTKESAIQQIIKSLDKAKQ